MAGGVAGGEGGWGGAGDISSTLPYTALPHGACPKGTSHNKHQSLKSIITLSTALLGKKLSSNHATFQPLASDIELCGPNLCSGVNSM